MSKETGKRMCIYVDCKIDAAVRERAAAWDRSVSWVMTYLVKTGLAVVARNEAKKKGATK